MEHIGDSATLYIGDCLDVLPTLPDASVDAIIADPPYGTTACKWDAVIPFEPMWRELRRVIKPGGAIVLFGSEPFSSALRMSNIKEYKYDWVWYKNRPSGMATAKYRPMQNHENISIFSAGRTSFYPIKEERNLKPKYASLKESPFFRAGYGSGTQGMVGVAKKELPALRNPTTVKRFDSVSNHAGRLHPTQKPVALLEYLIRTYTNEGETVLDFTMGSGTTGVAAVNTGREFIGVELDEGYCNIARERIANSQAIQEDSSE